MTKIAIVMKSNKPLCNIDDENLDINTLSAVINYTIIGGDNFLYYHDETNQNIIQHALNNVNDDITHLLYLDENLVLENLIIGNDTNTGLFMDNENIDSSKIVLIKVNENTKKNISDVGEIEINHDLLKCCLNTDSIELLCKKIIGLKIDFNESNPLKAIWGSIINTEENRLNNNQKKTNDRKEFFIDMFKKYYMIFILISCILLVVLELNRIEFYSFVESIYPCPPTQTAQAQTAQTE